MRISDWSSDVCSSDLLDARRTRPGLSSKVRELLAARAADMPDMETTARELLMTARTLRRRLLDEGTTYAELRDEVRQTLAEEFLSGPRMSIEQIDARLGYAERSEEHTSELQSLMRISYSGFCL